MLWRLLFISLMVTYATKSENPCEQDEHCSIPLIDMKTSQSSDYFIDNLTYSSARAVDGNDTKCAHTEKLNNSWWTIDLLGVYNISSISIFNIEQNNIDMENVTIHIGNSPHGTTNNLCQTITKFTLDQYNHFKCNTTMLGRYVTVFSQRTAYVILCEVQINGTKRDSTLELIKQNKTWEDALYHCRKKNKDLASILDTETQAWAELEAEKADTPFVWLGLHYTCTLEFWFWVDDRRLVFNNWAPEVKMEDCDMSAAMERNEKHLWFSKSDYDMFNFICK